MPLIPDPPLSCSLLGADEVELAPGAGILWLELQPGPTTMFETLLQTLFVCEEISILMFCMLEAVDGSLLVLT